jgi:biotin-(acetyl-CoA carboxylase) ligase
LIESINKRRFLMNIDKKKSVDFDEERDEDEERKVSALFSRFSCDVPVVRWYKVISSTMDVARSYSEDVNLIHPLGGARDQCYKGNSTSVEGLPSAFFGSIKQDGGRGQYGRVWRSSHEGLWFSGVHSFGKLNDYGIDSGLLSGLSLAVGVAIAESLREKNVPVFLKWPNDLVVVHDSNNASFSKLGGILIEAHHNRSARSFHRNTFENLPKEAGFDVLHVVIGVGINCNEGPELGSSSTGLEGCKPTSIRAFSRASISPHEVLSWIIPNYIETLALFFRSGFQPLINRWESLSFLPRRVTFRPTKDKDLQVGEAFGISEQGALLVNVNGIVTRIISSTQILSW